MGAFTAGQIIVLPFPFSDLNERKYRPALLLAATGRDDWIVCQITSNAYGDRRALTLRECDFASGSLHRESFIRPGKLFTAHSSLFTSVAGSVTANTLLTVKRAVVALLMAA